MSEPRPSAEGNGTKSDKNRSHGSSAAATSAIDVTPPIKPSPAPQPPVTTTAAPAGEVPQATDPASPKEKTYSDLFDEFLDLILVDNPLSNRTTLNKSVNALLTSALGQHGVSESYRILIMFDTLTLMRQDTDKIYQALSTLTETEKPIALIINSGGGEVDAGYLISKLCREFSPDRFITIVPRRAKSAATLICCGGDEIHMGSMSELGPIDPQVGDMPALGLKNAIQHLLELAAQFPGASDVLAKYLDSSLKLINLGYYERVAESAAQYALRLLKKRKVNNGVPPETVANTLVYNYKDHGFVIDTGEAQEIFGPGIIRTNSPEYSMANSLYNTLSSIESMARAAGLGFYFYGSPRSAPNFYPLKK